MDFFIPKLGLILCCFFFSLTSMLAQNATLTAGGQARGAGGTANYSLGQVVYNSLVSTDGSVNEGVQQPYELFVTAIEDPRASFEASAYPNPTVDQVILQVPGAVDKSLGYLLTDLQGRKLASEKILASKTKIPFWELPVGTYLLQLRQNNQTLKTFRIIKK